MDEDTSYLYVPIWVVSAILIVLNFATGCSITKSPHISKSFLTQNKFIHSCPEAGHGDCPICCDPYRNEINNEKTLVLDQ